jgi:diguanylate cyclase (GGDEF)-like protein
MLAKLGGRTRIFWLVVGYMMIALIGAIDSQFQPVVFSASLYLIPIAILSWFVSKWHGVSAAVLCTAMWLAADIFSGGQYTQPYIYYWNSITCLAAFIIFSGLFSNLRSELELAHNMEQMDTLTGIANPRGFQEAAQKEIDRCRLFDRQFTLCYIDIDNFRVINDQLGYTVGNQVLRTVAESIQENLRKSDVVARLGGDEFALIISDAGKEAAREAVNRIHRQLTSIMKANAWSLSFSIGVLICTEHPKTVNEILKIADDLMDFVKMNGKNGICYSVYKSNSEDLALNDHH